MRPRRRYSAEEKKALLATMERAQRESGESLGWVLSELGLRRTVYYEWLQREKSGQLADRVVTPRSLSDCLTNSTNSGFSCTI